MNETKERILDTAERLIGEQGYAATSLRQIIANAGVNLAAVHYHFGSKEELLDEVVMRKGAVMNTARLASLDRAEALAGDKPVEVSAVLDAFFAPMAEVAGANPEFVRLMGRIYSEGLMPAIVQKHFHPTIERFVSAFRRALPNLPQDEILWRIHFMVGAMAHTMLSAPSLPHPAKGETDVRQRMKRLLPFLIGGFRAPASSSEED